MQGSCVALNTAWTCVFIPAQSPQYTYGGNTIKPLHPISVALSASLTASAVLSDAIDAITNARSPTASTTVDQSSSFSSKLNVALSPSEPGVTIPVQP